MKKPCCKGKHHMMMHGGPWMYKKGRKLPCMLFGIMMMASYIISLWYMARLVRAVETMALADALDEMEEELSDAEKADLEGRIREDLF